MGYQVSANGLIQLAEPLIIKNNQTRQNQISFGMLLFGILLTYLAWPAALKWETDSASAVALGLLLLLIGFAGLLSKQKTTTIIDSQRRIIKIQDRSFYQEKEQIFLFKEIDDILVGRIGSHSHGTPSYHLIVKRTDGRQTPILVGIYDFSFSETATIALRDKIMKIVESS